MATMLLSRSDEYQRAYRTAVETENHPIFNTSQWPEPGDT